VRWLEEWATGEMARVGGGWRVPSGDRWWWLVASATIAADADCCYCFRWLRQCVINSALSTTQEKSPLEVQTLSAFLLQDELSFASSYNICLLV
jgi:hypothetical protein